MMYPGRPIPAELIERYGPMPVTRAADRLLSLRLPARREYITAAEYNALIDAIVGVVG